jgi:hypothetical protein
MKTGPARVESQASSIARTNLRRLNNLAQTAKINLEPISGQTLASGVVLWARAANYFCRW